MPEVDLALWQWFALFAAAAAVLIRAGITLAAAGDEIATLTGMGRVLVGMLLVAGATSMPEIVTAGSAALADLPDLAVGDLFGAGMANMALLGIIDLVRRRHVWAGVELAQARVGAIAIGLTAIAVVGAATPGALRIGWVGLDTIIVFVVYVAAVAWMHRAPRSLHSAAEVPLPAEFPAPTRWGESIHPSERLRTPVIRFSLAALAILVAGPVVAFSGDGIARGAGLGETFVGVTLLAIATTMPEFAAAFGAVRIGAYDLAVGNLFGSCAFNMAILFIVDAMYTQGPILAVVHPSQVVAGVVAVALMAGAVASIVHGGQTRIHRLEPDAALLLLGYAVGLIAVWNAAH